MNLLAPLDRLPQRRPMTEWIAI